MRLRILSGKREGEVLALEPGTYMIGTGRAADLQLREKQVGFKHAELLVEDEQVFLQDLRSKHGTFVDGAKVAERVGPLADGAQLRFGTAEVQLELAAPAEGNGAPEAAAPAASVAHAAAEAPAPVAEAPAEEELPEDVGVLQERVRDLRRRLAEKEQEAAELHRAIEGGAGGDGPEGYAPSVAEDLEARVLELQHIADERTAEALEKDEEVTALRKEVERLRVTAAESGEAAGKKEDAITGELVRSHERLEEARGEADEARAEVTRFEEANAELVLENEELKERVAALEYQVEQEAAHRGALVRQRVTELRQEAERLQQEHAEMRTLVEAYEEKIDELDERVEELEGENEALEQLVSDLRGDLQKAEQERETMVKTLRQKVKRLEQRLEEAQSRSSSSSASAPGGPELQDQASTAG